MGYTGSGSSGHVEEWQESALMAGLMQGQPEQYMNYVNYKLYKTAYLMSRVCLHLFETEFLEDSFGNLHLANVTLFRVLPLLWSVYDSHTKLFQLLENRKSTLNNDELRQKEKRVAFENQEKLKQERRLRGLSMEVCQPEEILIQTRESLNRSMEGLGAVIAGPKHQVPAQQGFIAGLKQRVAKVDKQSTNQPIELAPTVTRECRSRKLREKDSYLRQHLRRCRQMPMR